MLIVGLVQIKAASHRTEALKRVKITSIRNSGGGRNIKPQRCNSRPSVCLFQTLSLLLILMLMMIPRVNFNFGLRNAVAVAVAVEAKATYERKLDQLLEKRYEHTFLVGVERTNEPSCLSVLRSPFGWFARLA